MGLTIAVIVCAYNEGRLLSGCLYSLRAQTRPPDEILVIDNASTDETGAVARAVPGVRLIDEPSKGLVVARETARIATDADIRRYIDADCRAPITWLERVEGAVLAGGRTACGDRTLHASTTGTGPAARSCAPTTCWSRRQPRVVHTCLRRWRDPLRRKLAVRSEAGSDRRCSIAGSEGPRRRQPISAAD